MSPIERVLAAFPNAKKSGNSWMTVCPGHDDSTPSLSIAVGRDGRVVLKCFGGCATSTVLAAVGLEMKDLFDGTATNGKSTRQRIVAEYPYVDESGALLFHVVRLADPKDFFQKPVSGARKMEGVRRVPYRLPQLRAGVASERKAFIVEGEKDVDALIGLGFIATCNPAGAGQWKSLYNEHFGGAHVVIIPDNDDKGRNHARDIAANLLAVAADVRVVELPGLPVKGDVSDWLSAGGTADELKAMVLAAPILTAAPTTIETPPTPKPTPAPHRARSLRQWLGDADILQPPRTAIPNLAVEGRVTLLSGREKIGKSTLAGSALADASRGDDVLGTSLDGPVRSICYAIDEPVADAVRRFAALGADLDRIIINDEPRTVDELLAAMARDLETFPRTDIIELDTLSKILALSGIDPNSARDVEPVLTRIVDFFHNRNVAAILLYHTGKAGKEYRGSTAIGASVDEIITLRRRGASDEDDFDDDENDDGRRLLVQEGRHLRGRLHLTCAGGRYQLFDESDPPRAKIIETLAAHGTVSGRAALVKLAEIRKGAGLQLVGSLIHDGTITEKNGRLTLTSPGSQSSRRFPEAGTAPEPPTGTDKATSTAPIAAGSHFEKVGVSETGTEPLTTLIL